MKLPFTATLFWDTSPQDINPASNAEFIMVRILQRGDMEDIAWMMEYYGKEKVQEVFLKRADALNARSRNFWCFYFQIKPSLCTPKSLTRQQGAFLNS